MTASLFQRLRAGFRPERVRTSTHRFVRSRRAQRWGLGILAAIVLFGLLGFLAVPPLAKRTAERQLTELLGRPVAIGKLSLNPYTLRLQAEQVRIDEPGGQTPFFDLAKIVVDTSWGSLFRLKPVVDEFYLDAPHLRVVRTGENRFNFSDLIDKFAPKDDEKKDDSPTLFAVSNIHMDNGRIDLDDRFLNERHTLDEWQLGIPFIANVPRATRSFVEPMLKARIDGSPIAITGKTKPFTDTRESEIALKLESLDLSKLLSYSPMPLPVVLKSGALSTDLTVRFSVQDDKPVLQLTGTADLAGLSTTDKAGGALLDVGAVHLAARSLEPLRGVFHLDELRIDQPRLALARDKAGVLNVAALQPAAKAPAPPVPAATTPQSPVDVAVGKLTLNDGTVNVSDAPSGAKLALQQIALTVDGFSTVSATPASYALQARLDHGGTLDSRGNFALPGKTVSADVVVSQFALPAVQPFLEPLLAARIAAGTLDAKAHLQADASGAEPRVQVSAAELGLKDVQVLPTQGAPRRGKIEPLVALRDGRATIARVDLATRQAEVSALSLDGLSLDVQRERDGKINLAGLVKEAAASPGGKASAPAAKPAPWQYRIASASLGKARIAFTDRSTARPVRLMLSPLDLQVRDVSQDLGKPIALKLSTGYQGKGTLSVDGNVTPIPLKTAVRIQGRNLDVAAFEPYFASALNASIASARVDVNGRLSLSQDKALQASYQGGVAVNDVRMLDKATSDAFAGWRSLSISRLRASHGPAGTDVQTGPIAFTDFYGRVLLDANGRLNLGRIAARGDGADQSLTRDDAKDAAAGDKTPAPVAEAPAPAADAPPAPPLALSLGEITLKGGRVDYTDNFIRPNFSADLIDIEGTIGAFGTQSTEPARVDLRAQLAANGPVGIEGSVNPLAKPPSLDMQANTRGVELTHFSAYSTKYAGYPIVKGKLNVDLHYKLDNNQLTASNHLFIDQLTFGEKVENDTATKLPVQFAIGLLKNSRGEIDVDIPVSGSLSDPQFSVGGLIWRAVLNLLTRAVTAPFSLLASAFGGNSQELGYVEFAPGTAVVPADQQKKLETLAKALQDRTGLTLDLIGRVDPAVDGPALKEAAVERQVRQQKLRDVVGRGASVDPDTVTVTPEEHAKYLARAYGASDVKKPRNMIGLAKSLPPEEMKALMLADVQVGEAEFAALAQRRSAAVQQWFAGKIPASRLYTVAPKLDAKGIDDKGKTTRVEFALK